MARWGSFAGIVGAIVFVFLFSVSGLLRSGYSAMSQPVSDLGVGPNAWLLNLTLVVFGVLQITFAAGFYSAVQPIMRARRLSSASILLGLCGLGLIVAGTFTLSDPSDPTALHGTIHWAVGFPLTFISPVVAYSLIGGAWSRTPGWRIYGWYTISSALAAILLIVLLFVLYNPTSPLASLGIGGLVERLAFVDIFGWNLLVGWRLLKRSPTLEKSG